MTDLLIPAARVDQVRYRYPSGQDIAIDGLVWEIAAGSFTVVTGESGSGKSTQLRLLNGLVPHFTGGQFDGHVTVGGRDTRIVPTRDLSREVGFVFQEPDGLSIGGRVDDEIAFGLEQVGTLVPVMRRAVEEAMSLLGVDQLRSREMSTLSGGERQRVAIAAAMAMNPALLVLDEPTSQLDPAGADDLIQAVQRLNEEHGVTIVIADHRLERVLPCADRMRVLRGEGAPIEGDPRSVLSGAGSLFAPSLFRAGVVLGWEEPPLSVKEGRRLHSQSGLILRPIPNETVTSSGSVVMRATGAAFGHGGSSVLRDVDIALHQAEIIALIGPNGSGKTTLMRGMAGLHPISGGSISVQGQPVERIEKHEIGRQIGYLPQRARSILFNETVVDEVSFSIAHRNGERHLALTLLDEFDLTRYADRHPLDLSVGEQERLALAATLAGDPPILLLDEPTRGLDRPRKTLLAASLRRRAQGGQAVIVATHDVEFAAEVATRVVLLGGGEVIADGQPRDIFDGSLVYGTQINKVFGQGMLTIDDLLQAVRRSDFGDTVDVPE